MGSYLVVERGQNGLLPFAFALANEELDHSIGLCRRVSLEPYGNEIVAPVQGVQCPREQDCRVDVSFGLCCRPVGFDAAEAEADDFELARAVLQLKGGSRDVHSGPGCVEILDVDLERVESVYRVTKCDIPICEGVSQFFDCGHTTDFFIGPNDDNDRSVGDRRIGLQQLSQRHQLGHTQLIVETDRAQARSVEHILSNEVPGASVCLGRDVEALVFWIVDQVSGPVGHHLEALDRFGAFGGIAVDHERNGGCLTAPLGRRYSDYEIGKIILLGRVAQLSEEGSEVVAQDALPFRAGNGVARFVTL